MPPLRRLHVPKAQLASSEGMGGVALSPEQARHLVAVLRLEEGDPLELFDGIGGRYSAKLRFDGDGSPRLAQIEKIAEEKRPRLEVILAQALVKADKLELVIQKATELGCSRLVPFAAERSIVKLADEDRAQGKVARWRKIAEEASRQSGRTELLAVDPPADWSALFQILAGDSSLRAIALDPRAAALGLGAAAQGASKLLIAVGPEGGFSEEELSRAEANGFLRASMGSLILRTETAGLAALAVVQHLAGALG